MKHLQNSLNIDKTNAVTHHNIAKAYSAIKMFSFAVRHYLEAIECDRNHFESYICLGKVYIERDELYLARTTFKSVLRIDKTHEGAQEALKQVDALII